MLGLEPSVGIAYLLCICCTLVCVVYGAINWNKGDHEIDEQDRRWAAEEDIIEDEF